jgi:hypothetical protein
MHIFAHIPAQVPNRCLMSTVPGKKNTLQPCTTLLTSFRVKLAKTAAPRVAADAIATLCTLSRDMIFTSCACAATLYIRLSKAARAKVLRAPIAAHLNFSLSHESVIVPSVSALPASEFLFIFFLYERIHIAYKNISCVDAFVEMIFKKSSNDLTVIILNERYWAHEDYAQQLLMIERG